MGREKSATLTLRMKPFIRSAINSMSEREHRSKTNMLEVMVVEYCAKNGLQICENYETNEVRRDAALKVSGDELN